MKHFLVSDDIGNPVYFDHPDGRMLCLPVVTTQDVMTANFGEHFTSMCCGSTLFVFHKFEQLTFTVVSDQGESESFLRSQLRLVHELLLLVFGPKILHQQKQVNFLKSQKFLQKLVDTMCYLSLNHQNFLVESVEMLEVSAETHKEVKNALYSTLKQVPHVSQWYLFVGTKLFIAERSDDNEFDPSQSSDILLLIIYFMGQFHPHVRQLHETTIPIADYTDHPHVGNTQIPEEEEKSHSTGTSLDEGFVSANEEFDDDTFKLELEDQHAVFQNPEISVRFTEMLNEVQGLEEELKPHLQNLMIYLNATLADGSSASLSSIFKWASNLLQQGLEQEASEGRGEEIQLVQALLHACGFDEHLVDGQFEAATTRSIRAFQEKYSLTMNGDISKETAQLLLKVAANSSPLEQLTKRKKAAHLTHSEDRSSEGTPRGDRKEVPQKIHIDAIVPPSPAKEEGTNIHLPIYAPVWLRTPAYHPYWVYCCELAESVTLVIVNKNATGNNEEKERLNTAKNVLMQKRIFKSYIEFLTIRKSTNLPILPYMHQFPGLIHFVFVDRTANRVIAPDIGPFHGQQFTPEERSSEQMSALLKGKVWDMVYQSHKHLAQGYCTMLMKSGNFQYYYRLWVEKQKKSKDEDEEDELLPDTVVQPAVPLSSAFYKDLVKRTQGGYKCYELYSLYLGLASVNMVASNARGLIQLLKTNTVPQTIHYQSSPTKGM